MINWNYSTLCTVLVTFGPVTPEIVRVTTAPFCTRRQKSAYQTEYFSNYWTDISQPFSVSSHMCGNYKTHISFAVAKGRCSDNQLIFLAFCQTSKSTTFTRCSGVLKRNALTPVYAWFNSATNSGVTRLQWARVQVFQRALSSPKKTFNKQRRANFGPPTALGPRALHALHALLLRHWPLIPPYRVKFG